MINFCANLIFIIQSMEKLLDISAATFEEGKKSVGKSKDEVSVVPSIYIGALILRLS